MKSMIAKILPLPRHACAALFFASFVPLIAPAQERPNIIVIMCDDAGFADFGFTGGVAKTPTLDRLASEGMFFTRAYNNGRCWPTRQSFHTGLNPELADDWGRLNGNCVTLPEVLSTAGYRNYMVGKWHLGEGKQRGNAPMDTPLGRGYDAFYGSLAGAVEVNKENYIEHIKVFKERGHTPMWLYEGEEIVHPEDMADDYYETWDWTERGVEHIRETPKDQPFFLFMSYTAPHWNIDPLPEYTAMYDGMFDGDWETIRQEILQRQIEKGIFPEGYPLAPIPEKVTPITEIEHDWKRDREIEATQKYYATITEMDEGIRQLLEALEATGRAENTLILFFSDNGGEPLIGGPHRALMSNTPFSGWKVTEFEGGTATPLLAWWPGKIPAGEINTEHEVHLEDFMPTFMELSGAEYPKEVDGRAIYPHQGRSFVEAMIDPDYAGPHRVWAWEHDRTSAVWAYPWKANYAQPERSFMARYSGEDWTGWRLYNLADNRVEAEDLSAEHPEVLEKMIGIWTDWAQNVGLRSHNMDRGLPPQHTDAPRPDPATWTPESNPLGKPPVW